MAKRTLKTDLSVSGIRKMQKELEDYRNGLERKCRLLASGLASIGAQVASEKIGNSPLGRYVAVRVKVEPKAVGTRAILFATGETMEHDGYAPFNTLLAIEFGAGIHYNKEENPKASEFGYGVGTFPGQIHAFQDEGWYYWDEESQQWRHTYGVKATMPMYNASMEIQKKIVEKAREVFG